MDLETYLYKKGYKDANDIVICFIGGGIKNIQKKFKKRKDIKTLLIDVQEFIDNL